MFLKHFVYNGSWKARLHVFFTLFSLMAFNDLKAQQERLVSNTALAEKIYLQLDATVYTMDQTLWFKAIVTHASDNTPSKISRVLHVELVSPDKKIIDRQLIKLNGGIGSGNLNFKETLTPGQYLLRAYTRWNENFGEAFIFRQYISLFAAAEKNDAAVITGIDLVEKKPGDFWLQAKLRPKILDTLQRGKMDVFLSLDAKNDTLRLKENNSGTYFLDYPLQENADVASIKVMTKNGEQQSKTVALKPDLPDVQFFPESGNIVAGLINRIGFKVLNYAGKGVQVSGSLFDAKDEKISTFKSNALGMGSFSLFAPKLGNGEARAGNYYAVLDGPNPETVPKKFRLPQIAPRGNILSVVGINDQIRLRVLSNYIKTDSISIDVSSRGIDYFSIQGKLKDGKLGLALPKDKLPEGIIAFTLSGPSQNPLAERLYFNTRKEYRLQIAVQTDRAVYGPREKTTLDFQVKNADSAQVSILVLDTLRWEASRDTHRDILSYFLLDSELKGNLEKPSFYFEGNAKERHNNLDLLMLTQGWRKYNYTTPPAKTLDVTPEVGLDVKGSVGAVFSKNRKKEDVNLTLMTFGQNKAIYAEKTDSLGRFDFNLGDAYGEQLKVMIQSANKSGRNRSYSISLAERQEPEIHFDQVQRIVKPDSTINFLVNKNRERKKRRDSYNFTSGANQLDEVHLKGYKMTPERQKVLDTYGEADVVIDGKAIQAKEKKWSYGLYSVLMFSFPKDIRITRKDSYLTAEVTNGEPTLVVVDGMPVNEYSLNLIPNIPPSEVVSVELIKYAKNFSNLYSEVYPFASPLSIPTIGNIIAIYTEAGKGIFGVQKPKGIIEFSIPVFSAQKEFYSPKYETAAQRTSATPDLRSLIFWRPNVKVDGSGPYSTSFYNPDTIGEKIIVIEAIDALGRLGYKTLKYEVNEDN